jgi:glycosyltransferase involved in cell wall biosynthesis
MPVPDQRELGIGDTSAIMDAIMNDYQQPSERKGEQIVAIIPAFNEELTIGSVVLGAKKYVSKVIVVDDGSSDRTSEIAALAGAQVIRLKENSGKAYAVKRGFAEINSKETNAAVIIDADGQHDTEEIGRVMAPIVEGKADLVIGSRFIEDKKGIPFYRKIGQHILNKATNAGSQKKVTDTQSGYRALSATGIENMDFESDGYGIESSMILHFASRGLNIMEVPIGVNYNVPHKHKKNPVSMGFGLMNHLITLISLKKPLMYIGVPGMLFIGVGLFLGLASLSGSYLFGQSWIFESILAGFMVTFGAIVVISSLTLNSIAHIIAINNKKAVPVVRQSKDTTDIQPKPKDMDTEMIFVTERE